MLADSRSRRVAKWTGLSLCALLTAVPLATGLSLADLRVGLPLVLLMSFTLYTWIRDHGLSRRGHCSRCGYNLTGNVSGVCSQCGRLV